MRWTHLALLASILVFSNSAHSSCSSLLKQKFASFRAWAGAEAKDNIPFQDLEIAVRTDHGAGYKYGHNEDGLYVATNVPGFTAILAAADGLGGSGGGQVASAAILRGVHDAIKARAPFREFSTFMDVRLQTVYNENPREATKDMGAVAVLAGVKYTVDGVEVHFQHKGDSKGAIFRPGSPDSFTRRRTRVVYETEDHSAAQEYMNWGVPRWIANRLRVETKSGGKTIARVVVNQLFVMEDGIVRSTGRMEQNVVSAKKGDWVVLGSDGLWDALPAKKVARILERADSPEHAVSLLRDAVADVVKSNPMLDDNFTVIVARL